MNPTIYKSSSMGELVFSSMSFPVPVSITFDDGFNFEDRADFKVYVQIEPPEVIQGVIEKLIDNKNFYDLILAWDEKVLRQCKNSVFFPHCETLGPKLYGL